MNPMREIRVEKVTINIGAGEAGEKLEKAKKLLEKLANGKKVVVTHTHKRTSFGMAKGRPIGVKVTFRGKEAIDFLMKALNAVENKLKVENFDNIGNFSFGIKEYIDLPNVRYDPDIGIMGMDVCVTIERPGYRVKKRSLKKSKIGKNHVITKEEAMEWAKEKLGVKIGDKEEE